MTSSKWCRIAPAAALSAGLLAATAGIADDNNSAPLAANGWFGLFFDDGVGVIHARPSGSTAETDYAPGIAASTSGGSPPHNLLARLTVQPQTNATSASPGGINDDQGGRCNPGNLEGDNGFSCGGPFTEWGLPYGGVDGNFDTGVPIGKNGSTTSIDIYLDANFAATARASGGSTDYRFDWDSDLLDSQGTFLQDYIFNVATGQNSDSCAPGAGGFFVIEASTNSQRGGANAHNPIPPNPPQICITQSGWYTFTHTFHADHNNNLEVDMRITTADNHHTVIGSWTLHPTCLGGQASEHLCALGHPVPFAAAGANFLGWFPDQEINDLAVDDPEIR